MIINLIISFFILLIAQSYGMLPYALNKKKLPDNPFLPPIIGTAVLGIISQLLLLGGRIDFFSLTVVVLGAATIHWRYKTLVQNDLLINLKCLNGWPKSSFIAFSLGILVIAFQSSQITKINDMGMYYLQTMKWMKTFGLVKGIANLHPAYGLYSNWHSLNALFSFEEIAKHIEPTIGIRYTGLNGYIYILSISYFVWEIYFKYNLIALVFTLLYIPIGFLFLTAPSPDLPLIFYTTLLTYLAASEEEHNWEIFVMACFTFWLKPPGLLSVMLGILAYRNLWKQYSLTFKFASKGQRLIKFSTLTFLPLVFILPGFYKNHILSGHLLYPIPNQNLPILHKQLNQPIWQVPKDWNHAYRTGITNWGNQDDLSRDIVKNQLHGVGILKQIKIWIQRDGYKGLMNRFIAIIWIFGAGLFIWRLIRFKINAPTNYSILILLLMSLISLGLEWVLLRQYRLLLPSALALGSLCFIRVKPKFEKLVSKWLPIFISGLLFVFCFFPFQILKKNSRNKQVTTFGKPKIQYLILPFNHYDDTVNFKTYCWDSPLPCQSKSHGDFLYHFGYQVAPLGKNISDGYRLIPVIKAK